MSFKKKNTKISTLKEVLEEKAGMKLEEFVKPKNHKIPNMDKVSKRIFRAKKDNEVITIVGDYDCDGITSSTILYQCFKKAGLNVKVRLPKRFSEGYGLSEKIIDEIDEGLVVTVDNGISAVEPIKKAKDKGLDVIIIDHHLSREDGEIPPADIIIDPHITKDCEFNYYCGAGLSYKLAQEMFPEEKNKEFLRSMQFISAIGTVADVMPIVDENRRIVEIIKEIETIKMPAGLKVLLQEVNLLKHLTAEDIVFKISPMINALGRMEDDGAFQSFKTLNSTKFDTAKVYVAEMVEKNNKRKEETEKAVKKADETIKKLALLGNPLFLLNIEAHEGILGLVANKVAEKYKTPTIILTETQDGFLRGSGRTYGDFHLKDCLDRNKDLLLKYGGHKQACGLSVEKDKFSELFSSLLDEKVQPQTKKDILFDLELDFNEIPDAIKFLEQYEPFGVGFEKPIIKTKINALPVANGKYYQTLNADGLKFLCGQNITALMFGKTKEFEEAQTPKKFDVVGTISNNYFYFGRKETITPQIMIEDFAPIEEKEVKTSLANLLESMASSF